MRIKTVLINRNGTPVVINASDFRYGSDKLWDQQEDVVEDKPEIVKAEVKIIHKGGGRWIVEVNGHKAHDGLLSKAGAQALEAQYV